jgi:hypothetical protein
MIPCLEPVTGSVEFVQERQEVLRNEAVTEGGRLFLAVEFGRI